MEKAPIMTDVEIEKTLELAQRHKWENRSHPRFEVEKELLETQRDADHLHYLKQFVKWLEQYDTYSQYYAGIRQTSPVRRHDIPNADLESLLKEAGGEEG